VKEKVRSYCSTDAAVYLKINVHLQPTVREVVVLLKMQKDDQGFFVQDYLAKKPYLGKDAVNFFEARH
jgi:hypothetical protein